MKLSRRMLRDAAKLIANGEETFMCLAIGDDQEWFKQRELRNQLEILLKNHGVSLNGYLGPQYMELKSSEARLRQREAMRNHRVLFLLLLAEAWE